MAGVQSDDALLDAILGDGTPLTTTHTSGEGPDRGDATFMGCGYARLGGRGGQ